jgi:hypothetical protein
MKASTSFYHSWLPKPLAAIGRNILVSGSGFGTNGIRFVSELLVKPFPLVKMPEEK